MNLTLFLVVRVENGVNHLVYDGSEDKAAAYKNPQEAWGYAEKMRTLYPQEEYNVIRKQLKIEVNPSTQGA